MKRQIGLLAMITAFIVVAVYASQRIKSSREEVDRVEDISRIQKEYLERIPYVRATPDETAYKSDINSFLRWYFREVEGYQTRYKIDRTNDDYLRELAARSEAKKDPQLEEKRAAYKYTRNVFDMLKGSNYQPVFTAADRGLRLDVISADVNNSGGKPQIHLPIILWGAQRELRDDGKLKRMVTTAGFNVRWALYDAKGKLYGEINAAGGPNNKVDFPERYITAFPPQTIIGDFALDLAPAEAVKSELTFSVTTAAPNGSSGISNFTWKMDVPANWKLPAGQKWEGAEDSIRSEDEITPPNQ